MDRDTAEKYLFLMDAAREDPEYRHLCSEYARLDASVLDLLDRISERDRDMLMDYIGVLGAISRRLLEIAGAHLI